MKWITFADENYRELADLTLPLMQTHCATSGVEFKRYTELLDPAMDVYWNRIPITIKELYGSGFMIWSDADILFAKSFDWQGYVDQSPEHINIWVSSETKPKRQDVCCGFMVFRECPWTFEFLRTWKFVGAMRDAKVGYYEDWNRREQESFNVLHDWFTNVHGAVERIPEWIIANPISSQVNKNACVGLHFWGNAYKAEALKQIKARI